MKKLLFVCPLIFNEDCDTFRRNKLFNGIRDGHLVNFNNKSVEDKAFWKAQKALNSNLTKNR